jgi:hypothetical protein
LRYIFWVNPQRYGFDQVSPRDVRDGFGKEVMKTIRFSATRMIRGRVQSIKKTKEEENA